MLLPGEKENEFLHEENIISLIRQVGGSHNPQIRRRQIYTFHAAIAETFSEGRVFLLGDAAHLMPPFGGQGMNCGLRDAHNLSWKLQKVIQGEAGPALLETYNQESHKYVDDLIGFSKFLGRIVMPTSITMAFLRDSIFFILNMIPPIRKYLSQAGIKPLPRYKKGFLFVDGSKASKSLAGLMLPQPEVKTAQGQKTLLDNVLGPDFALLRIGHKPQEAFTSLAIDDWQQLGAQLIAIENEIDGFPANQRDLFILVRPDRYIYGVFTDGNERAFIVTLRKHLASIIHTQK
jgi:3-(3-hydroxy-phenyl)propionate hydroxylase